MPAQERFPGSGVTGNPMPPETNERPAWKDTIKTYAGHIPRV